MNSYTIDVAKDFSPRPFGRFKEDGEKSAEVFREEVLNPAIAQHKTVEVDLSGSNFYSSSFLEEAFGGLVREHGYDKQFLHDTLILKHTLLPSIVEEIKMYIDAAKPKKR